MAKRKVGAKAETPYNLTVKILGKFFTSTGATLVDAVNNLEIRNAKGMSVWKVEHNGKVVEKILGGPLTFRLFNSAGMVREIVLKNFTTLFNL